MLTIDARIQAQRDVDERLHVPMAAKVLAHRTGSIREPVRCTRIPREQQQVRAPYISGGNHEGLRAKLHGSARGVALRSLHRLRAHDARGDLIHDELAHQRARVERNPPGRAQRVPREVGRVLRAHGTDGKARVVAAAFCPPVIWLAVFRRRLTPHRDAGARRPILQELQVVRQRNWRHWKWLAARIHGSGALFARHAHDLLGFLIERFEVVVRDGPVRSHAEERLRPEILRRPARCHAAPMHGESANTHRAGLQWPVDLVPIEMVVGPRVLAMGKEAITQRTPSRQRCSLVARFHDHDRALRGARKLLRDHRRADTRADDAHIALDDHRLCEAAHACDPASGRGFRDDARNGRHVCRPICDS